MRSRPIRTRTTPGALALLRSSAVLAARTGTERLIVKTPAEAHRIPAVEDNVRALEEAAAQAARARGAVHRPVEHGGFGVLAEARTLVESVLELGSEIGPALVEAFRRGCLDVPYCLHADNAGRSRSFIDARGSLQWRSAGAMPVRAAAGRSAGPLRAEDLIGMLSHVQRGFDRAAVEPAPGPRPTPLAA